MDGFEKMKNGQLKPGRLGHILLGIAIIIISMALIMTGCRPQETRIEQSQDPVLETPSAEAGQNIETPDITDKFSQLAEELKASGFNDENTYEIFENDSGSFLFRILPGSEYGTFNTALTAYTAEVYIPEGDGFTVHETQIPLEVVPGGKLSIVSQDEVIKAVVSDTNTQYEAEAIFNESDYTFAPPRLSNEPVPVDYELPALLLGLSDSQGNMRTIFIRKTGGELIADEFPGRIIHSRGGELYTLRHYELNEEYTETYDDGIEYRTGALDIKKLLCGPLDADLTDDFNKIFADKTRSGYFGFTDVPLYVGEDYICYIRNGHLSGGGTWNEITNRIRFEKPDNLPDYTYDTESVYGGLIPGFEETTLARYVYGEAAGFLFKDDISSYGGKIQPYVDFTQLSIKRNHGRWSLMLPVMEEYFHPGNGSYGNWVKSFAVYSNDVPDPLNSREEPALLDGWGNWTAKDLFKFPDSDAALFQFDYFIGICKWTNTPWESGYFNLTIPVRPDEYIVSISLADNNQNDWEAKLIGH